MMTYAGTISVIWSFVGNKKGVFYAGASDMSCTVLHSAHVKYL